MTEIAGKVALVTGGGSGIGRGLVLGLAAEGATVVVADLLKERAEGVAAEVENAGGKALAVACDVSDRESVERMKAEANNALGMVHLLFANAGVSWFDLLTDMSPGDVDWIIQVNLMGTIHCLQVFLPDMMSAREGHVIATASNAGLISGWVPQHSAYSAAKAGIIGLMLNLRIELDEAGVGCTVYCPGGVRGRIGESMQFRPDKFGGPTDKKLSIDLNWVRKNLTASFEAEEIAPHVLRAVRENSVMVVDHADQKQHFYDHFVNHAVAAFDDAAVFEKSIGWESAPSIPAR